MQGRRRQAEFSIYHLSFLMNINQATFIVETGSLKAQERLMLVVRLWPCQWPQDKWTMRNGKFRCPL